MTIGLYTTISVKSAPTVVVGVVVDIGNLYYTVYHSATKSLRSVAKEEAVAVPQVWPEPGETGSGNMSTPRSYFEEARSADMELAFEFSETWPLTRAEFKKQVQEVLLEIFLDEAKGTDEIDPVRKGYAIDKLRSDRSGEY